MDRVGNANRRRRARAQRFVLTRWTRINEWTLRWPRSNSEVSNRLKYIHEPHARTIRCVRGRSQPGMSQQLSKWWLLGPPFAIAVSVLAYYAVFPSFRGWVDARFPWAAAHVGIYLPARNGEEQVR